MRFLSHLKASVMRIVAVVVLSISLSGCITLASLATGLTIAGTAAKTSMDIVAAVKEARGSIAEKDTVFDKLKEFRRQFCQRPELRAESRDALVTMLVEAGVPKDAADNRASGAKELGIRLCGDG